MWTLGLDGLREGSPAHVGSRLVVVEPCKGVDVLLRLVVDAAERRVSAPATSGRVARSVRVVGRVVERLEQKLDIADGQHVALRLVIAEAWRGRGSSVLVERWSRGDGLLTLRELEAARILVVRLVAVCHARHGSDRAASDVRRSWSLAKVRVASEQ